MMSIISSCPAESTQAQAIKNSDASDLRNDQVSSGSDTGFGKIMHQVLDADKCDRRQKTAKPGHQETRDGSPAGNVSRPLKSGRRTEGKPLRKRGEQSQEPATSGQQAGTDAEAVSTPQAMANTLLLQNNPDQAAIAADARTAQTAAPNAGVINSASASTQEATTNEQITINAVLDAGGNDGAQTAGESKGAQQSTTIDNTVPSGTGVSEAKDSVLIKNLPAEKQGHDAKSSALDSLLNEKNASQAGITPSVAQNKNSEAGPVENQAVPAHAAAGFTAAIQQEQLKSPNQQIMDVPAAKAAANAETSSTGRTMSNDASGTFDNTVSIVREGNRLAVHLEPEGLGKLHINLSLHDGVVKGQIHVSNDGARSLIENNMRGMMDALTQDGLSVGGFSVALRQDGSGNNMTGNGWADETRTPDETVQQHRETARTSAAGLVNIFV